MKVVLFCGGFGLRMRTHPRRVPKPMERIGSRPIVWHLMRYYAHYGHREFILCLGYRGDAIAGYFHRRCRPATGSSGPHRGATTIRLRTARTGEWTITLAPTGTSASIGERIRAIGQHLARDDVFLANYADGVSDLDLAAFVDWFRRSGKVAGVLCVRPTSTFHFVALGQDGLVEGIRPGREADTWVNGGFFAFRRDIFDYIGPGEDLVEAPFRRLIARGQLVGYRHEGFWACMDTPKDRHLLQELHRQARAPWQVWRHHPAHTRDGHGAESISLRQ